MAARLEKQYKQMVGKPALVVELKYDKTAYSAIQQIKERCYAQALEGYVGIV